MKIIIDIGEEVVVFSYEYEKIIKIDNGIRCISGQKYATIPKWFMYLIFVLFIFKKLLG